MKIQYLVASITFAAVLVAPAAYSAPGGGAQITHFLTRFAFVSGIAEDGSTINYFSGQVFDDLQGVAQGYVSSNSYDNDTGTSSNIFCFGPAYANAVSVKANGSSTVNATLNPASSDCYSDNVSVPITVTADGQADGDYANSKRGNGEDTFGGTTYKYNNKYDEWSQTFSDANNGFNSGTFSGSAFIEQKNGREKVK